MKTARIILAAMAVLFVVAQVIPLDTSNPPVTGDVAPPPAVAPLLRKACYDCHSNETAWPWYAKVAPVRFLVWNDVREGREELNFSTWNSYDAARQAKLRQKAADELRAGEMPPGAYTLIHAEAELNDADRALVISWLTAAAQGITTDATVKTGKPGAANVDDNDDDDHGPGKDRD